MSKVTTIIAVICLGLAGCSPYYFELQKQSGWPISGKRVLNHNNVDVPSENQIILNPQSSAYIRCEQLTDGIFNTEVTLFNRGTYGVDDEVIFSFRSTPYDDTVMISQHQLAMVLTLETASIVVDDVTTTVPINVEPGKPFRIEVQQHGSSFEATVACEYLGRFDVTSPTTQWVGIHTLGQQRVEVRDPRFYPLRDDFRPTTDLYELFGQ